MQKIDLLIRALREAREGSLELDWQIVEILHPHTRSLEPALHYTRSLDARFAGERVVRVEQIRSGLRERWRAWLDNGWIAEASTEILSRRLAWLTYQAFTQDDAVKIRRDEVRKEADRAAAPEQFEGSAEATHPRLNQPDDEVVIGLLCQEIRRLRSTERTEREEAIEDEVPLRAADAVIRTAGRSPAQHARPPERPGKGARLLDVLDAWREESRPTVKNIARVSRSIRRFGDMFGNRSMNSYTTADVRRFLLQLQRAPKWLPLNLLEKPMPLVLAYAEANPGIATLSPRSIEAHLKDVRMLFNWAMVADLCQRNPCIGLRVVDRRVQSELRVGFDAGDLKRIFERSPTYTGCLSAHRRKWRGDKIIRDSLFWFPLAALFTGARMAELAQATVADFKEERGVTYLEIHAAGDNRHLKTQAADRQVPIHPELIRLGFLNYIERQRKLGFEKVFEDADGQRNIRTVKGWSQFWTRFQASAVSVR